MQKIYSKVNPELLLHLIVRLNDFKEGRQDVVDPSNFIQCSLLNLNEGHTFKPHKHNWRKEGRSEFIPQESWHIVKGKVKCIFYDIDDQIIEEPILNEGDTSFSLFGGHNYLIMENDSKILEYKVGPYEGQKIDKTFI